MLSVVFPADWFVCWMAGCDWKWPLMWSDHEAGLWLPHQVSPLAPHSNLTSLLYPPVNLPSLATLLVYSLVIRHRCLQGRCWCCACSDVRRTLGTAVGLVECQSSATRCACRSSGRASPSVWSASWPPTSDGGDASSRADRGVGPRWPKCITETGVGRASNIGRSPRTMFIIWRAQPKIFYKTGMIFCSIFYFCLLAHNFYHGVWSIKQLYHTRNLVFCNFGSHSHLAVPWFMGAFCCEHSNTHTIVNKASF